jgi:hypothetical protein
VRDDLGGWDQFLDGNEAWRDWHATNGRQLLPLLALVEVVRAVLRPGVAARPTAWLDRHRQHRAAAPDPSASRIAAA